MPTEETAKTDSVAAAKVASKMSETLDTVTERINEADSILVTLSKDPTVDEMTAALGLTLMLDKYGKHVTAIYSGKTPNALEFLRPDETFEADTNSLQDFIIALNKEKADHLRYKIEGDFVKVYITPYKTTISESDLEFSRGEVNVDLVIAIDVIEAEDLDAALAQHGRIMHNASLINISNAIPGRLGGVEWNDTQASSVSEMIVALLEKMGQEISKEVATALLTGIISATERFSNEKTTPGTMALASRLMELGADQQLIVAQMASAKEREAEVTKTEEAAVPSAETDLGVDSVPEKIPEAVDVAEAEVDGQKDDDSLEIKHEEEPERGEELTPEQQLERMISGDTAAQEGEVNAGSIMDELKNVVPVVEPESNNLAMAEVPQSKVETSSIYGTDDDRTLMQDGTMAPLEEKPKDYGAMIDEALAEEPVNPVMPAPVENPVLTETGVVNQGMANPAIVAAPVAPVEPEVQPMGGVELPPPPVPDTTAAMPPVVVPETPAMPEVPVAPQDDSAVQLSAEAPAGMQVQAEPVNPVIVQPEQNPVLVPPVDDPGAFKIPGM